MKRVTVVATALLVAVLAVLTISVRAQDFNSQEKTYLTFSGPVELPGITLPAGTYTFKLADTLSRNVVQVLSQDEKTVHGQFLFVQAPRRDPNGETLVMFKETAEGATPAIQYWYYPTEGIGKEFVYPKDQAVKIAARTRSSVLSTEGEIGADSRVSSIDGSGKVTPFEPRQDNTAAEASVPAQPTAPAGSLAGNRGVEPQRETSVTAQADIPAPAPAPAPRPVGTSGQSAATELPRTASPLPLTGLFGLFSLVGGLGLRAFRR